MGSNSSHYLSYGVRKLRVRRRHAREATSHGLGKVAKFDGLGKEPAVKTKLGVLLREWNIKSQRETSKVMHVSPRCCWLHRVLRAQEGLVDPCGFGDGCLEKGLESTNSVHFRLWIRPSDPVLNISYIHNRQVTHRKTQMHSPFSGKSLV